MPSDFTWGAVGVWSLLATVLVALIRAWPAIKQRVNEARRDELDANSKLRGDLLGRIASLEAAAIQRDAAMLEERRRCDEKLRDMQEKLDGLLSQFIQFQLSTARAIPPGNRTPEIDNMLEQWEFILRSNDEPAE